MRILIVFIIAAAFLAACASNAPSPAGTLTLGLRDDPRPPACAQGSALVCNVTGGRIKHYDGCRCRFIAR